MKKNLPSFSALAQALPAGSLVGSAFLPFCPAGLAGDPELVPLVSFLSSPAGFVAGRSAARVCRAPQASGWSLLVVLVERGVALPVVLPGCEF